MGTLSPVYLPFTTKEYSIRMLLLLLLTVSLSTNVWADVSLAELLSLSALNGFHSEQPPNNGCGPNPLLALVTDMPPWLQHSLSSPGNTVDMMRSIRSDGSALREFLKFKRVLNRFKDCVKTGDGIRAKKSGTETEMLERRLLAGH